MLSFLIQQVIYIFSLVCILMVFSCLAFSFLNVFLSSLQECKDVYKPKKELTLTFLSLSLHSYSYKYTNSSLSFLHIVLTVVSTSAPTQKLMLMDKIILFF